jgi:hypothetical protein
MGLTWLVWAAVGCSGSPTHGDEDALGSRSNAITGRPGDEVTLAVGASVHYPAQGLTATYRRLIGDSRCPMEAVCVWEGDAEVLLEIASGVTATEQVNLHTTLNAGPRSWSAGGWTLELVRVDPFPSVNRDPDPAATLAVVKLVHSGG